MSFANIDVSFRSVLSAVGAPLHLGEVLTANIPETESNLNILFEL